MLGYGEENRWLKNIINKRTGDFLIDRINTLIDIQDIQDNLNGFIILQMLLTIPI